MANAGGSEMGFQVGLHGFVVAEKHSGDDGVFVALESVLGEECGEVVLDFGGGRAEGVNGGVGDIFPLLRGSVGGEIDPLSSHILLIVKSKRIQRGRDFVKMGMHCEDITWLKLEGLWTFLQIKNCFRFNGMMGAIFA